MSLIEGVSLRPTSGVAFMRDSTVYSSEIREVYIWDTKACPLFGGYFYRVLYSEGPLNKVLLYNIWGCTNLPVEISHEK